MGQITDVVLLLPLQNTGTLERLNAVIKPLNVGELADVSAYAGGSKVLTAMVWAAAFNYLSLPRFVKMLREFVFDEDIKPLLFVQEDSGCGFRQVVLKHLS